MTSILIVDDHPMMRKGIRELLELQDDITVVEEANSGEEALNKVACLKPDMVLLDLNMKNMNGIETLKKMREQDVKTTILMLTVSDNHEDVIESIRAGADGYLLKDLEPEQLLEAVSNAATGQIVISPQFTPVLAKALRGESDSSNILINKLTNQEQQILKLIAKGFTNKAIAKNLNITEATVKVHVKNLLKKLGLRSRVEAAVWAFKNKLN